MCYNIFKLRSILLMIILINCIGRIISMAGSEFPLKYGDKIQLRTDSVNVNLVNGFKSHFVQGYVAKYDSETLYIQSKAEIRIDKVIKKDGSVVKYSYMGGKYNSDSMKVSGIDVDNNNEDIPLSDIEYIEVTLFVKDKRLTTKISADSIHRRLLKVKSFPSLLYKVPINSINQIEKWKKGNTSIMFFTALGGGLLGYLYGDAVEEEPEHEPFEIFKKPSRDTKIVIDVIIGVCAGATVGYIIGKSRWQNISLDKFKLDLKHSSDQGLGLFLSYSF